MPAYSKMHPFRTSLTLTYPRGHTGADTLHRLLLSSFAHNLASLVPATAPVNGGDPYSSGAFSRGFDADASLRTG